jgi:hypothetical protein
MLDPLLWGRNYIGYTLSLIILCILSMRPVHKILRYRQARTAVFHLARFNDVRAIGELFYYRRRRTGFGVATIHNEHIERELTRLFDDLTGHAYIPGEDSVQAILRKECLSTFRHVKDITSTRAYFYIALMRFLAQQESKKNMRLIKRISLSCPDKPNWRLVRETATVLVQAETAAQAAPVHRSNTAMVTPSLQSLRRP